MSIVNKRANRNPIKGLLKLTSSCLKAGISFSGAMAWLIRLIPVIITAKPMIALPMIFFFSVLPIILNSTPAIAKKGTNEVGLHSSRMIVPPSIVLRDKIHALSVAPRFAPMIRPAASLSLSIPALTNPTVRTVVAEEDCTTPVSRAPARNPIYLFFVILSIALSKVPPARFDKVSLIVPIP